MRSFIYSLMFSSAGILSLTQVQAQKKQTIYYPDGKVAFEGSFQLAWSQAEQFESGEVLETDPDLEEDMDLKERGRMLSFYKDMIPSRVYEGKCRYYYRNGKLFAEGNYESGFKNGTFKFYHPNGQLGAQQSYEWGMASGHWESWDKQGRLSKSFYYQPIPESTLQSINEKTVVSDRENVTESLKFFFGMGYEVFFNNSKQELSDHWRNLDIFKQYVTKKLYHKAIKEGTFKVWEQGKPYLEMNFSNNIPAGTWTLYDNGQPAFIIVFEDGKIIKATDLLNPANNFGSPEHLARKKKETWLTDDVNAIDPGLSNSPQGIFRSVQQKPEAGYNVSKYIRDNLKVPANRSSTGTKVVVEFIVLRDGSIDNKVRVLRSDNVEPDMIAEVIRVIRQMPKWKPGMENGKPVDVYFSLPVHIGQQ